MTKEEFIRAAKLLKGAYPNYRDFMNCESLDVWYEALQYINPDEAYEAIRKLIRHHSSPPAISDIWDEVMIIRKSKERFDPRIKPIKCAKCKDLGVILWEDLDGRPMCRACSCEAGRALTGLWKD